MTGVLIPEELSGELASRLRRVGSGEMGLPTAVRRSLERSSGACDHLVPHGGEVGEGFGGGLDVVDVDIVGNRPAVLADVTHIRWVLKRLDPGARGTLSYQAIVR